MSRKFFHILFIIFIFIGFANISHAEPQIVTLDMGSKPYRILADEFDVEYWIVNQNKGLILLHESPPDNWIVEYYSIPMAYDATGPDQDGNIYISVCSDQPSITIFNIISRSIIGSIPMFERNWRIPTGLTISGDESELYVCSMLWPEVSEFISPGDAESHPDSGIIYRIDLSTQTLNPVTNVGALPETIYLTVYNSLLISTEERHTITSPVEGGGNAIIGNEEYIDIIDLPSSTRISRIMCNAYTESLTNQFVQWSADGRYIAMCNSCISYNEYYNHYIDGIWILDTLTNSIEETFPITGTTGFMHGVNYLIVSSANPGEVYISISLVGGSDFNRILVIDHETGDIIRPLYTGTELIPEFIYEIPDGRLIVTGGWSGKIAIIDPS